MKIPSRTLGIFFAMAALFFSGCATTANYEKILRSWVGNSADDLVSKWGPPTSTYPLTDGGKVIEYIRSRTTQTGGYSRSVPQTIYHSDGSTSTTYVQKTTPVRTSNRSCRTWFTVNKHNRITRWNWKGNSCKARAPK